MTILSTYSELSYNVMLIQKRNVNLKLTNSLSQMYRLAEIKCSNLTSDTEQISLWVTGNSDEGGGGFRKMLKTGYDKVQLY